MMRRLLPEGTVAGWTVWVGEGVDVGGVVEGEVAGALVVHHDGGVVASMVMK
jgi:hypothetical protein